MAGSAAPPEASRAVYAAGWRASDRPAEDKYLLSGIASCQTCGGSLVTFTRDYKRAGERGRFYGCNYNHKRGAKVCANRILIRQDKLDRVVLDAIAEALDERILERAVVKTTERLACRSRAAPGRRAQLERDLADVEARLQRGLDALLAGIGAAADLHARLRIEKDRKASLAAELDALKGRRGDVAQLDDRRLLDELRARVRDVRGLLGRDIPRMRQILRKLLVRRLECQAFNEGERVGYRFKARGSYASLLPAGVSTPEMVTPAGFEPAFAVRHALWS
jgi:recombinase-like zinc beta ribbon protein